MRREHNVNVDMRIGVHTGFILSGIIGNKRWQYDIWSKDVTIANHMESAGVAGAVHITRQTKDHLADTFRWTQRPFRRQSVKISLLRRHLNMPTFRLILLTKS